MAKKPAPGSRIKEVQVKDWERVFGVLDLAQLMGLYTVQSAAKILGVDRSMIYQLIEDGTLEGGKAVDEEGELIKVLVSKRSVKAYKEYREAKANLKKPAFG